GTGTGVLIPYILRAVGAAGLVVALDISREMLLQAARKGFPPNVHLLQGDMQRAGLREGTFDRVLWNAVFPHFEHKERALCEAWRVLRPGGMLVISHPIGREAVNRLHAQHRPIAEDLVPDARQMFQWLNRLGWTGIEVIDEPQFYLARASKPPTSP
ncbi:MAG: class I SAM-dependent methyltransferase, partial [Armatimonadetes bacterium]|nr:class I SAM-dependent methyltransferase [Armatimonadota bacterium]